MGGVRFCRVWRESFCNTHRVRHSRFRADPLRTPPSPLSELRTVPQSIVFTFSFNPFRRFSMETIPVLELCQFATRGGLLLKTVYWVAQGENSPKFVRRKSYRADHGDVKGHPSVHRVETVTALLSHPQISLDS